MTELTPLPERFVVETRWRNERRGFSLVRATLDGDIDTLKSVGHENLFYSIDTHPPPNTIKRTQRIKKHSGNIEHTIHWTYTNKRLRHGTTLYPVLKFTPMNFLPATNQSSFIPIVDPAPLNPPNTAVPNPVLNPMPAQITLEKIIIKDIPKHALRLLLLGALIEGEECPITGSAIDATNGGVTSCFHLFERDAIATWLAMPNSNKKCPVCTQPCDVYLLDN